MAHGDHNVNQPCKKCGHCPTCGKGGVTYVPYPVYPTYPQPNYVQPAYWPWYGTNTAGYTSPSSGTITWNVST